MSDASVIMGPDILDANMNINWTTVSHLPGAFDAAFVGTGNEDDVFNVSSLWGGHDTFHNVTAASKIRHVDSSVQILLTVSYMFGIAGNVAALAILARHETLRNKRQTLMLRCLAWNDLIALLGSLAQMYLHLYLPPAWVLNRFFCGFRVFWRAFGLGSGCVSLVMAIERWLALTHPFWYQKHVTYRRIQRAIFSLWTLVTILACMPFMGFGLYYESEKPKCTRYRFGTTASQVAYSYVVFGFGMLMCVCIVCCNLGVIHALCQMGKRSAARRISSRSLMLRPAPSNHSQDGRSRVPRLEAEPVCKSDCEAIMLTACTSDPHQTLVVGRTATSCGATVAGTTSTSATKTITVLAGSSHLSNSHRYTFPNGAAGANAVALAMQSCSCMQPRNYSSTSLNLMRQHSYGPGDHRNSGQHRSLVTTGGHAMLAVCNSTGGTVGVGNPNPRNRRESAVSQCSQEEISFARLMAVLCIFYVVCWLPQLMAIPVALSEPRNQERLFFRLADVFIALNFVLDPYIYVVLRGQNGRGCRTFLQPIWSYCCCFYCCRHSSSRSSDAGTQPTLTSTFAELPFAEDSQARLSHTHRADSMDREYVPLKMLLDDREAQQQHG